MSCPGTPLTIPAATLSVSTWTRVTDGQTPLSLVAVVSMLLALPSQLNTCSLSRLSLTRRGQAATRQRN